MSNDSRVVLRSLNGHVDWQRIDKSLLVQCFVILAALKLLGKTVNIAGLWAMVYYAVRIAFRDYEQVLRGAWCILTRLFGFYSGAK